jgi:hypothetical protein
MEPHPIYGKRVPKPLWAPPPAPPPERDDDGMGESGFRPTVGQVIALSGSGMMILVGCICLMGVSGSHATPKRWVRRPGDVGYVGSAPQHREDGEHRGSIDDQLD